MDILGIFQGIKTIAKDEKDTFLGLLFFILLGLTAVKFILLEPIPSLQVYAIHIYLFLSLIILGIWYHNRRIPLKKDRFNIGIASFELLHLDPKANLNEEAKRSLKQQIIDYVYTALHFNKEHLSLEKYIEIINLPNRIKVTTKNESSLIKKVKTDLMIWGEVYYRNDTIFLRPRFEFLKEPANLYFSKFKAKLNNLDTFKINLSDSIENQNTELSKLMHYLAYLGVTFQGSNLTSEKKFKKAQDCLEFSLKSLHKKAFHSRSLSDIYLITRFLHAQNFHKWGSYLLEEENNKEEALTLYTKATNSLFKEATEMTSLKDPDQKSKLESTLLYGIYLLIKSGSLKQADKKLEEIKPEFNKNNIYLYHLYKGLVQKSPNKAEPHFNKALKICKNHLICNEKIADYFFSKGKFKKSIKFFEARLSKTEKQIYNPELLEEDIHEKLSKAYTKELQGISATKEKILALINEQKNYFKKIHLTE
jgi:hypothetical protein